MAVVRKAEVVWEGELFTGKGEAIAASSGAFKLPVSWPARAETPDGKTSPEELLAAAHATCFGMSLAAALARAKTPPKTLNVTAVVTLDKVATGFKILSSALEVKGNVPGVDAATFDKLAQAAKESCPVSQAFKGNMELSVKATLA
jgi:lipoyl-dependent peroxiredoxin